MRKVLIADRSYTFKNLLTEVLEKKYKVKTCTTGMETLKLIRTFKPEILLLDVNLIDDEGVSILHMLSSTANDLHIIAVSFMLHERALLHYRHYNITCLLTRPCSIEFAAWTVDRVSETIDYPTEPEWVLEANIDGLLLSLGFRMGASRYACVAYALKICYLNPGCAMKELYIDVAKECGGTVQSVEKAIRDAVECAYKRGHHSLWKNCFVASEGEQKPWGSNASFLATLAKVLKNKERLREYIE